MKHSEKSCHGYRHFSTISTLLWAILLASFPGTVSTTPASSLTNLIIPIETSPTTSDQTRVIRYDPPSPLSKSENSVIHDRQEPIKIMIVGDSISQGLEGDFTWRYRLFQWFKQQEVTVQFVGPYLGTLPQDNGSRPLPAVRADGLYAAGMPTFNSNHFASWGRQCLQDIGLIGGMVETYQPDYLLVELGFNDLGWWVSNATGTLQSMKNLVDEARAAKPDLKMALANVPQRFFMTDHEELPNITDQYNTLLKEAIPVWSTPSSPIQLVQFREFYSCNATSCPAGYDGLHPNTLGEYQIAHAFSQTLQTSFDVGNSALVIPASIPTRAIPAPPNVQSTSTGQNITITWDKVYGVSGYAVRSRVKGEEDWGEDDSEQTKWIKNLTKKGRKWEVQVASTYGNEVGDYGAMAEVVEKKATSMAASSVGLDWAVVAAAVLSVVLTSSFVAV